MNDIIAEVLTKHYNTLVKSVAFPGMLTKPNLLSAVLIKHLSLD